jgi:hypothetical protein
MGTGKKAQRGTQKRRCGGKGEAKKIMKKAKVRVLYWKPSGFKKKKKKNFGTM